MLIRPTRAEFGVTLFMNQDEKIANKYLLSLGYENVVFEPDGNIPPDFLLNGKTAVEVRKLNQHFARNGKIEALEQVKYKLIPMLDNMLNEFEGDSHDSSAFVCITYSRPVDKIKESINEIRKVLLNHLPRINQQAEFQITDTIQIELLPVSERHESAYVLGFMPDMDAGGFLVSEIYQNLQIVLEEKTKKILKFKHKYNEWWLILVGHIGLGLCERDIEQLRGLPKIISGWDKVVLISPQENGRGFEI